MIKVLFPLPETVIVAFSGGVDSAAVVDFLSRKHEVICAFFHHNTENSERAYEFVSDFCAERELGLLISHVTEEKPKDQSWEEYWRLERYKFLDRAAETETYGPVITAHHLDDCVETYLWSALHGKPKVPQLRRGNILRPFLTTPKSEFVDWCTRKEVPWIEDLSNHDTKYTRNYVRKELVPKAQVVNPGLSTVVKKIVEKNLTFEQFLL